MKFFRLACAALLAALVSLPAHAAGTITFFAAASLTDAMNEIGKAGRGILVLLREPLPTALSDRLRGDSAAGGATLRDYGIGAQILLDLGVREMILLSNTQRNIVGLEGYGLSVVERRPFAPGG